MNKPPNKPPQVVKATPDAMRVDPVLSNYKKGVTERAAQQRTALPRMPDLVAANSAYKPGKDPPMTIGTIGEANRRVEEAVNDPTRAAPGLRPETIAGLKALQEAVKQQQQPSAPESPKMPEPEEVKEKPKQASIPTDEETKKQLRNRMDELDDLEFDRVLRNIQFDAINNEAARKAVRDRVSAFDLVSVLAEGEFRQEVPIIPGQLTVYYRSISAIENQALRLILAREIEKDKRKENIAPEIYGLMQTVCTVYRINGQELPPHMLGTGYSKTFDEDAFQRKFELFIRYPTVLLHALGTHGYWFEQRTREAFSHEALKTG